MSGKIKLIASDVDGTLVKDGSSTINPVYYALIEKLHDQGILFVASSGRTYGSISKLFAPVITKMGAISESGTMVWKEGAGHVLAPIPYDFIEELNRDVSRIEGAKILLTSKDHLYVSEDGGAFSDWLTDGYGYDLIACPDMQFPKNEVYVKYAIYYPKHIDHVTTEFCNKWKDRMHLCYAGDMWLDCLMSGINKGYALSVIQKDLGITPEETMVFGDNQNDIEMMTDAAYSYAVSTARQEVKSCATEVIPSYDEDGVLCKILEMLNLEL